MERLDQLGEHSYASDIYMVERLSVENQPPYRGLVRPRWPLECAL